ncbi:MAG: PH domain-containing protein [Fimbriimonadaceae bacterium]|nr:PH domain-containing protein [Fimbriimonadaceae bacterium]
MLQSQLDKAPINVVWILVGLVVLLLVRSVLFVDRQFKAWGYLLTDNELIVRYGVWWRVAKYIPRESIQHVDINQGPVDRWNRLAQVVVHTAGVGAVVTIPGLTLEEAQQLRDRMIPTEPAAE